MSKPLNYFLKATVCRYLEQAMKNRVTESLRKGGSFLLKNREYRWVNYFSRRINLSFKLVSPSETSII